MFPDVHPSKGSVPNMGIGLGCPAIIFDQMSSDQWKSTTRAQIDERQPTFKKGRRVGLPRPPPTACSAALPSSVGALACPAQTATATGDRSWNLRPHQPPPHAASIAPVRHDTTHHAEHPAPRPPPPLTPPPPRRRREGKKNVPDISAQAGLLVPPREVLVIPPKEKTTYARDLMITKHMSKLTAAGRW